MSHVHLIDNRRERGILKDGQQIPVICKLDILEIANKDLGNPNHDWATDNAEIVNCPDCRERMTGIPTSARELFEALDITEDAERLAAAVNGGDIRTAVEIVEKYPTVLNQNMSDWEASGVLLATARLKRRRLLRKVRGE